jgi:pimeloyl-ACP methyl ester carboxylesterase
MGTRGSAAARAALSCAVAGAACLLVGAPAAAATRKPHVESVPVRFRVANVNRSGVPCASDGRAYTVRGHLTGPRAALNRPRGVTLYLFGYDAGEWNWRLTAVPQYDHARAMARAGHVSLTVDELGYGSSARPPGMATCVGAEADIAHQIVRKLRTGSYVAGGRPAPRFARVILAGHDIGGALAEIEAYSFKDVDGLVQVTFADQGFTPYIVERSTVSAFDWCTTDAPDGYHYYTESPREFRTKLFFDPEPRVLDAATRLRSRNPCGLIRSLPSGVYVDMVRGREIEVPVLVVFGAEDTLVWSREGERQQQDDFPRSHDRSTVFVPRAGHFPMLERTAPTFRRALGAWLDRHGA